jgi:nitroimidazol reductase NimA-like FMN-containing flavoprotein (pyridoxamine 5'-phosphate oxidase superfamily)
MKKLTHWQSAIAWGDYEEIESEEGKMNVFKLFNDRLADLEASETMKPSYRMPNPHPHNAEVKAIIFRIRVYEKTGRFEQKY